MAPKAAAGVAVAATDDPKQKPGAISQSLTVAAAMLLGSTADAAVLPEERADALFHHYDGGGMEISGPSVLVRKNFRDRFSVTANYYVDSVTSASIDVTTTASPYTEERTETRLGADYLHDKTSMGISWTRSEESDYLASTVGFSLSQDFFGDLSSLSFGYALGTDEVRRNGDALFSESVDRHSFRLGWSQVLSRKAVAGLALEVTADEGFLNNPYRSVRYVDSYDEGNPLDPSDDVPLSYAYQPESYPDTRTSTAVALRAAYHLPWQDALKVEYRFYTDTWGIGAENIELGYSRDLDQHWRLDGRVRTYSQNHADFYSDLYPYQNAQDNLARDKEMSTFDSLLLGMGASYIIKAPETSSWKQMSFNLQVDFIQFDYSDFRDLRKAGQPGTEPMYSYDATVTRLFYSLWF